MRDDELQELLEFVTVQLGAEAIGLAILMPDGQCRGANMVLHESENPDPETFDRLAAILVHCATRCKQTARKFDVTVS